MTEKDLQFEHLWVDETLYSTRLTAKFKNRKTWLQPDNRKVIAFLPGTVTDVLVQNGDLVNVGQTVMKYEAMKMINNVQATATGKVKAVHVKAGDKFSKGTLLVELE